MKAVVIESPRRLTLKNIKIPEIDDYSALIRMEVVTICNSTDIKLKNGLFPGFDSYPTILGHEGVGTVVKIGSKVKSYKVGDRVINPMCMRYGIEGLSSSWGTMAEYSLAVDHNVMKIEGICDEKHGYDGAYETQKVIPPDIPSRQAILLSTWREVYSSFEDFGFQPGKSILIFGGGPVGLSFVAIAKNFGMAPVCLTTRSQWKLDIAKSLGADMVFPANESLLIKIKEIYPRGFDFVIDAVGSNKVINQTLQIVSFNGTVGIYGTISEQELQLKTGGSPYNWKFIMHQWPDYSKEAAAHEPMCESIRQGKISSEYFITHEYPFELIEKGFESVENNKALKVLLYFKSA